MKIFTQQRFLAVYSGVLTVAFASVVLLGAHKAASNASFDQITVHRINIVEPNGTTRMVISDHAEFPGSFYMGKEHPRTDRDATGMLFNDDEGTENGGLIFGGKKDEKGVSHSWGHLSFDEYHGDQTMVIESDSEDDSRNVSYGLNDYDGPELTPDCVAAWQRVKAMPPGLQRVAAAKAWRAKYPGGIISRGYFGRGRDKAVSLVLKDRQGHDRLVARVAADGTPVLEFLDENEKVVRTIGANSK